MRRLRSARLLSFWIGVVAAALVVSLQPLNAAPSGEQARATVADLVEGIWNALGRDDLSDEAKIETIAGVIDSHTNTKLLGRLALGRTWLDLSEDQQKRYAGVFPEYIRRTLASQLLAASGDVAGRLEDNFRLLGSREAGRKDVMVRSELIREQGPPVGVDWRLRDIDEGSLAIIDLVVDGVSLLITKRNEFAAVIERGSIDEFLAQLEASTDP